MAKRKKTPSEILQVELEPIPAPPAVFLPMVPDGTALTPMGLAALAREVAMDIKELPEILKFYKLTDATYADICKIPFYARALEVALIEWNSALSTPDRIKIEAAATLEDALHGLGARMKNKDEAFPAAIEAGKLFAKIAGLGEPGRAEGAPGEKFTININLGADTKLHYEKDVTPILPVIEDQYTKDQKPAYMKNLEGKSK